jgi:hypothetical protein
MLKPTTKSSREIWPSQKMREMTKSKSDMMSKTQLSEHLFKPLFLVLILFSNMTQLMKNANNFLQDKRK